MKALLAWWYETQAIHLREREKELAADAVRIALEKKAVAHRAMQAEMRVLQYARPA